MTLDPKNLHDLPNEALLALHRISLSPGPISDLIEYADLWDYGLLTGGHAHAEITEAGREYLTRHF